MSFGNDREWQRYETRSCSSGEASFYMEIMAQYEPYFMITYDGLGIWRFLKRKYFILHYGHAFDILLRRSDEDDQVRL